jgi:signal peptidase I
MPLLLYCSPVSDLAHIPTIPDAEARAEQRSNVKRHLIASILSTVVPGAGQLFLGGKRSAIVLFVTLMAISVGFWPLRLPRSYAGLLFLLWMCLLLLLFAVFGALLGRDMRFPGRMSRWWILAGVPLSYVGVNLVFTFLLVGSGFRTFKFASPAMEPTIFVGDKFIIDKLYYRHRPPRRGDVVVMRFEDAMTVKRVIAIPGDTIQGKNRAVFLNGQLQDEPYIEHNLRTSGYDWLDTFGPVAVPAGKYFVMGDNRDTSLDSRKPEYGLLDDHSIVGRPLYGYRIVGKPLSWELK